MFIQLRVMRDLEAGHPQTGSGRVPRLLVHLGFADTDEGTARIFR